MKRILAILFLVSLVFAEGDIAPWQSEHVPVKTDKQIGEELEEAPKQEIEKKVEETSELKTGVQNRVQGIVLKEADKKPLKGVEVVFDRGDKVYRAVSDEAGIFRIDGITPGAYDITYSKKGYAPNKQKSVSVKAIGEVREILLEKKVIQGSKIAVKKPQKAGSDLALRNARKKSAGVVDAMGAEAISKGTDSDAGSLARRVTGTSVVGGKYVFVRGLGERYTNMTLNGLPVPTPEKDKRVVPQDLFPASALESFAIYKTFSPERLPDFAGGSLYLTTKGLPSKDFLTVGLGLGTIYESTGFTLGNERLTHENGSPMISYFGYGDGFRDRPQSVPTFFQQDQTTEETALHAYQFNNQWATDTATVLPNHSLKVNMGRQWKLGNGKLGLLAGFAHSVKYSGENELSKKVGYKPVSNEEGVLRDSIPGSETPTGEPLKKVLVRQVFTQAKDYTIGSFNTTQSAVFNFGFQNRDHVLWFKNLYANLSTEKTSITRVLNLPDGGSDDRNIQERFLLDFNSRRILVNQIGGGHWLGTSALDSISWAAGFGYSMGATPDRKLYRFLRIHEEDIEAGKDTTIYGVDYKSGEMKPVYGDIKLSFDNEYGTRYWDEFSEKSWNGRVDQFWIVPPEWSKKDTVLKEGTWFKNLALPKLYTGQFYNYKNRSFDLYRYNWARYAGFEQNPEAGYDYINEVMEPQRVYDFVEDKNRGFGLTPYTFGAYTATETNFAYYLNAQIGFELFHIPTQIMGGMRVEHYGKDILIPFTSKDLDPNDPEDLIEIDEQSKKINETELDFYPSSTIALEFIKDTKILFGYSQTKVRPELREVVPSSFYDPEEGIINVGVDSLKNTEIQHYDVRFDWYLPSNQMFSTSFFYKNFDNPIEVYINAVAEPDFKTFQNAKRGFVRGIEFELDTKIEKVLELFGVNGAWAKDLTFYTNAAIIESGVELDLSSAGANELTSKERPMIGQSPWLFNAKLTLDQNYGKNEMTNGLLFNVSGKRIKSLGSSGVGDLYELPFPSLDYLLKLKMGSHSFGFKAKNLLLSKKRLMNPEVNKTKEYYNVSDEVRDAAYADVPDEIIQSFEKGLSLESSYSYSF